MHRRLALALTIAAVAWTVILVAAPAALARPSLAAPAASIYAASSRICHQRPERSFHAGGRQLPVCARCFGLYLSGAFGAVLAWGSRRRPGPHARMVLASAAVPTALTWTAEVAGLASFSNLARALAALPLGIAAGWLFVQMLRYDSDLDGHQIHDRRSRAGNR
ncbi:MAG TPA: DUF2085 domain-containing protein [Vicinamibacterales bacterium]|nr:DUF2085 domain-containing protein [Vicinamibacterales bacterium]